MNRHFYDEVYAIFSALGYPVTADFPFLCFDDRQLLVHLVRLDDYASNPLQFQALADHYDTTDIRLVQLWEDVWYARRTLVCLRIEALLGRFERIHARQTVVKRLEKPVLQTFLIANHLQGSPQVKYKYGLFLDKVLMAAASFSAMRPMERNGKVCRSYELVRFANLAGHTVAGGLSRLLARFVADVQPDDVMTYADRDWSRGTSYEQLGFTLMGHTVPQLFYIHPHEGVRRYPQHLPDDQSERDLLDSGFLRIYNAGNKKYLKTFSF